MNTPPAAIGAGAGGAHTSASDGADTGGPALGGAGSPTPNALRSGAGAAPTGGARLRVVPVGFRDARGYVEMWHRHHPPPRGCKFCLGVATDDDVLRGVAIVGRPVARMLQDGVTLEVTRTATDGTPNTNSALYGAAWRAARALAYRRLITYTQQGETGVSLHAAGWRVVAERPARQGWDTPSRPRDPKGTEGIPRTLWEAS